MTMLFQDIMVHPSTAQSEGFKYEPDKFPGLKVRIHAHTRAPTARTHALTLSLSLSCVCAMAVEGGAARSAG